MNRYTIKNLTGLRYNKLTVVSFSHRVVNNGQWYYYWNCICDCGKQALAKSSDLIQNKVKSCGCLNRLAGRHLVTHGLSQKYKREYAVWNGMIQRCENKNNQAYANYGGRGIRVCKRWHLFVNFFEDIGPIPAGLSLERKNNNAGYNKMNCVLATRVVQGANKRNNVWITWKGETKTLTQWAHLLNLKVGTLHQRIKKNMPIEEAFKPLLKAV